MEKRAYSEATEKLLQRMDKVALRQKYVFDKQKIRSILQKVYKVFDFPMPRIVWCVDITDERFLEAAGAAGAAGAARAAWSARAARAAWSAWAAGAARAAWSARAARAAWAAWSARAARAAGAAGAAASDYDFDYLVFEHKFLQTNKGNENDKKFLQAGMLFLEAKEEGMGYFSEKDGILYVCPNPIISLNPQLRYHSTKKPAIYWKNGLEIYYLNGVNFEKELWKKVTSRGVRAKDVFVIQNLEQRRAAYEIMDKTKMKALKNYTVLDEAKDDFGKPMKIISFMVDGYDKPFIYYQCVDATTEREYFMETEKMKCWEAKEASFGLRDVEWVKEW